MSNCTISNQADADKLNSTSCLDILIQGATGRLNFTTIQHAGTITVIDSPAVEAVYFPQLTELDILVISNATALTNVSLPMFKTDTIEFFANNSYAQGAHPFTLNISTAPVLSMIELMSFTSCANLALFNVSLIQNGDFRFGLNNITAALSVGTDSATLYNLQDVGELHLVASPLYNFELQNLRSAGSIRISNANNLDEGNFDYFPYNRQQTSLQINNSFILESSVLPDTESYERKIPFSRISTIGQNLEISSMFDHDLDFEGLSNIGGDLSLVGNNNCSWNFDQVTNAGSLTIIDNPDATIPLFPKLQTVHNIHLRGNIDLSQGPNIFPSLVLASGNVTVEAWNSDYNCSKLVSQWNNGLINNLSCNGTDGTDTSPKQRGSGRLASDAVVGIGVGSGAVVLLAVVALVWLILHHKHQRMKLDRAKLQMIPTEHRESTYAPQNPPVDTVQEVDGQGIIREKPHDPIIRELPNNTRHELPTSPS
ncbi:hypothetical protein F4777DRAFT_477168 [Nemania sp. FL0916]|nr:hypothetical protein F4777DRAFT_477168 [Nemania sp. FL0916]